MSDWADADPIVAAAILAVTPFPVPTAHKVEAMRSAYEAMKACLEVEEELGKTGEYQLTPSAMVRVKTRCELQPKQSSI